MKRMKILLACLSVFFGLSIAIAQQNNRVSITSGVKDHPDVADPNLRADGEDIEPFAIQAGNGGVAYARVWVSDSVSGGPLLDVVSDSPTTGSNLYTDAHLPGGDLCVIATIANNGAENFYPASQPVYNCVAPQPRSVRLYFPIEISALPCSNYDSGRGQYYVDDYRVLSSVFARSGSDMRFGLFCGGLAYSIRTDKNVPITTLDANTKRVTNVGSKAATASLYQANPNGDVLISGNFAFPFEITFQRVP